MNPKSFFEYDLATACQIFINNLSFNSKFYDQQHLTIFYLCISKIEPFVKVENWSNETFIII